MTLHVVEQRILCIHDPHSLVLSMGIAGSGPRGGGECLSSASSRMSVGKRLAGSFLQKGAERASAWEPWRVLAGPSCNIAPETLS